MKKLNKENFDADGILKIFNPSAKNGLDKDLFHLISSLTPIINVDLLIKNSKSETLLTWRDDEFYGPGWHLPGGVIRFKEKFETRIKKTALNELGINVESEDNPIHIRQIFNDSRDIRGHFISLLFKCKCISDPPKSNESSEIPIAGSWKWHHKCPDNIIHVHKEYSKFIDNDF